jgi:hypothetical protein
MDVQIVELDETAAALARVASPAGLLFGRTLVALDAAPLPAARRVRLTDTEVAAVVIQKGRLFQDAYPDVEVLLDRGRHLLVRLPTDLPPHAHDGHAPCFDVLPAVAGQVIYAEATSAVRAAAVPAIAGGLDALSLPLFTAALTELAGLPTRHSNSSGLEDALNLAQARLEAAGYACRRQAVVMPHGQRTQNLSARLPGAAAAPRILVMAHVDSVNAAAGAAAAAPGADDNASGSAGVIALAAALADLRAAADVGFVLFGGEEQGLFGSRHFVAAGEGFEPASLRVAINMDMIGSINRDDAGTTLPPTVLIEGGAPSAEVVRGLQVAASTYTDLAVRTSLHYYNSDHASFLDRGMPAVLTIEGGDGNNRHIHSVNDVIDHISSAYAERILRANLAYVLVTCSPEMPSL